MADAFDEIVVAEQFKSDEDRLIAGRTLDLVRQTLQTADPQSMGFLNPAEQDVARAVLHRIPDVRYVMYGGYRGAERKRVIVMPSYFLNEYLDYQIGAIEIVPETDGEAVTHGDYLGAILALGLNRDKVGDIVVCADRAQVFVDSALEQHIETTLTRVGRFRATARSIDPDRVEVVPERVEEIERTVASLRLDSVAAAGYSTSRTHMTKEIKARRVKLNWNLVLKPDIEVQVGDVISMAGRGRVVLEEVLGETRKGRVRIRLKKLI